MKERRLDMFFPIMMPQKKNEPDSYAWIEKHMVAETCAKAVDEIAKAREANKVIWAMRESRNIWNILLGKTAVQVLSEFDINKTTPESAIKYYNTVMASTSERLEAAERLLALCESCEDKILVSSRDWEALKP